MTKLDKLIELTTLEKLNRRNRLVGKLRQQEKYGDIEELSDPVTNFLNTNTETWQAHGDAWQAHNETIEALQNKTLAALDSNNNDLRNLGRQQQSSFLD